MNNLVILKPVISEKSFASAGNGIYVFQVTGSANKKIVAEQIHSLYKVDAVSVNIINIPGKVKKAGKKTGKRSDTKKALVRIKPGQKIAIFETEEEKKVKKEASTQIVDTDKAQIKSKENKK